MVKFDADERLFAGRAFRLGLVGYLFSCGVVGNGVPRSLEFETPVSNTSVPSLAMISKTLGDGFFWSKFEVGTGSQLLDSALDAFF